MSTPRGGVVRRSARAVGVRREPFQRAWWRARRGARLARPHRRVHRDRILCYHSVGTPEWGLNDLSPAVFRDQLHRFLDDGYTFAPAAELAAASNGGRRLAVTFDDGVRSVVDHAEPVLAELGVPWTMFVVADWADGRHPSGHDVLLDWDEVGALAARGVDIGSHSLRHPDFARLDAASVTHELRESRARFRDRVDLDVTEFAIPFGCSRHWPDGATEAAHDAGYTIVYAQSEDRRPAGTVGRTLISGWDPPRVVRAALEGAYDTWEEPD